MGNMLKGEGLSVWVGWKRNKPEETEAKAGVEWWRSQIGEPVQEGVMVTTRSKPKGKGSRGKHRQLVKASMKFRARLANS